MRTRDVNVLRPIMIGNKRTRWVFDDMNSIDKVLKVKLYNLHVDLCLFKPIHLEISCTHFFSESASCQRHE